MRIRSIKYLDARTLAHNVRQHYAQDMALILDYNQIVALHEGSIIEFRQKQLDFHRGMKWVMLDWGWVIETSLETAGKEIIKETLISHDGRVAVITARFLLWAKPDTVWKSLRDDDYPVGSIVRLAPAEPPEPKQCLFDFAQIPF
jgi:hypothetical protein